MNREMDQSKEYHKDIKPELYVSLDGFEGPLDLLLTLAKKQKVDLKKLQLGILADQFLDYLRDQRYKFKLEFAGDYLVMASWLTLLKSQLIIPEDELKEEDADKINELLALRLQRLAKIRENANWLFDRPQLFKIFFRVELTNIGSEKEGKKVCSILSSRQFSCLLLNELGSN